MREPQRKTIDGVTFEVTPLGFRKGRQAFTRLAKALGPALGAAESVTELAQGQGVNKVLERLVGEVSDDDLDWFSETFAETTRFSRDGERWPTMRSAEQDALFGGNLTLFFRWLMFCMEVNFSDFLGLLRSAKSGEGLADQNQAQP